jgi:hypothetical protein
MSFGRKRVHTGVSNFFTNSWNSTYEEGRTGIGFNFEAVGNSIGGKTIVAKLHKIRYTPLFQKQNGSVSNINAVSLDFFFGMTVIDRQFFTTFASEEMLINFYSTNSVFGIHHEAFTSWGVNTADTPARFSTYEVELDMYIPFVNINSIGYYAANMTNPTLPQPSTFYHAAELIWSYELMTPMEYQALKQDWQSKTNLETPIGKLALE